MGSEVETLENSPLGTRVSVDQICRACELEISEIFLIVDLRVIAMSISDWLDGGGREIHHWSGFG